ncbi:MAG: NAD-dependent deacylase [Bacteroidales bacterium]|nr:NAD-dependent deacylase [Bacteroidales bacterium]MCI2121587.1 NAD-dependent deacylase [Bacteroidales bacterium]MCI2145695.1 NAD-dependent deacylase [Bacteroidales bacterium]
MQKLVVLSGAGVSAESGMKTYRDSNGLWENYNVQDVASIDGWYRNPKMVLEFYNMLRKKLQAAQPNEAHSIIAELEKYYDVVVVTQNIDNLHERGGSTNVIHLHGELTKVRPVDDDACRHVKDIGYSDVNLGDCDSRGKQLRPHVVWFGEPVPMIQKAAVEVSTADILLIIGTSMNVYPAAGLVGYAKRGTQIYLIDPQPIRLNYEQFYQIQEKATSGMRRLREILLKEVKDPMQQ